MALVRLFIQLQTPRLSNSVNTTVLRNLSLNVFSSASLFDTSSNKRLQQSARYSCSISFSANNTRLYSGNSRSFSTNDTPSGDNDNRVKTAWRFVVSVVKSFMKGTRQLWSDVKTSRSLAKKMGDLRIRLTAPPASSRPFATTPEELQLVYRTKADIMKMFPTLFFFFIPFFGYFVPFIAYFVFPKHMLSQHFWNASQREKYQSAAMEERQLSLLQLHSMVHDVQSNRELAEVLSRAKEQLEQSSPSNGDWDWLKHHEKSVAHWRLSNEQLNLLTKLWGVPTVLPFKWWKQRRLTNHLAYIYTTDWLMTAGKNEQLNIDNGHINEFALERCLLSTEKQDPVIFLRNWIKLNTTFSNCPTSLIAHLPLLWFQR